MTVDLGSCLGGDGLPVARSSEAIDCGREGLNLEHQGGGLGADIAVSLEISDIECESGIDQVHVHDGHQAGIIMDLGALDAVVLHEPFPNRIDRRNIREQSQPVFDAGDFLKGFLLRKSQPVYPDRPSSHIPELSDVLRAEEEGMLLAQQSRDGGRGLGGQWVGRLGAAQENIRVNEDTHQWSRPSYMASRLTA